ncbi:MAG: AraC family transcriptional regulator [Hyphomicrobiales bacterium]|nr:AraC family transcriptional regulator [Hyphomicrobiales bacterium]
MNPVAKALWYIESHLEKDFALDDIAASSGVSRFHLSRAFGAVLNCSVMEYVRSRRLSEAARRLAAGAPDILSVALEAGYGSHEAFTRAFRDRFGKTPEQVRADGRIETLTIWEPVLMEKKLENELAPPRFVDSKPKMFVGLGSRFSYSNMDGVPALWQRFQPHIGHISNEVKGVAYGIVTASDDEGFDYAAAVEVTAFRDEDPGLTKLSIPSRHYAVFAHRDHISAIRTTMRAIWSEWLPRSGREVVQSPTLERYGPKFDPHSGNGGLEIWLPVRR